VKKSTRVKSSSSILTEETYRDILHTLENQEHMLKDIKDRIRCCKENEEEHKKALAGRSQYFHWVQQFELLNGIIMYKDFPSHDEAIVVSHVGHMFNDIYSCHMKGTMHKNKSKTETMVRRFLVSLEYVMLSEIENTSFFR
jgi:hypothetical protein